MLNRIESWLFSQLLSGSGGWDELILLFFVFSKGVLQAFGESFSFEHADSFFIVDAKGDWFVALYFDRLSRLCKVGFEFLFSEGGGFDIDGPFFYFIVFIIDRIGFFWAKFVGILKFILVVLFFVPFERIEMPIVDVLAELHCELQFFLDQFAALQELLGIDLGTHSEQFSAEVEGVLYEFLVGQCFDVGQGLQN